MARDKQVAIIGYGFVGKATEYLLDYFYPGTEIPLETWFSLNLTDKNQREYNSIISGESVEYEASGILTVESAWSIVEPEFDTRN